MCERANFNIQPQRFDPITKTAKAQNKPVI